MEDVRMCGRDDGEGVPQRNAARSDIEAALGLRVSRVKRWSVRVAVLAVLALAAHAAFVIDRQRRATSAQVRYETRRATRGELAVTVSATGTLEPVNEVEVGSEVSGTMRAVEADFNDRVRKGQVLARIDTSKLEAQVQQSEAALQAARAKVLEAEATCAEAEAQLARLSRVRALSGGKVPSELEWASQQATVARAKANVASAQADVSKAQGTLDVNRSDLGKAVICSPIDGVVLSREIEPGQTVAASFSAPVLFKLAEDLAQLELQVDVDEADVGQVREGQEATFTVDAYPDKRYPATIKQVRYGSKTTDGVVTYTTVLRVNNADLTLRPGMTASAVIVTQRLKDVLLVPSAALRFEPPQVPAPGAGASSGGASLVSQLLPHPPRQERRPGEASVAAVGGERLFVLSEGRAQPVPVETGLTDGTLTEVKGGGVEVGAEVIVEQSIAKE